MPGCSTPPTAWGGRREAQDPLSFRCAPHVLGAALDALTFARDRVGLELGSSQGNPALVGARAVSVGNFDSTALCQALDLARIGVANALTAAAERTLKLVDAAWSGLPTGLTPDPTD